MGPLTEIRSPGVYSERGEVRQTPIVLGESGIVGFVGLCERGPTNTPIVITHHSQFYEIFGDLPEGGFLSTAVEGFFKNGGKRCYVVRVAHLSGRSFGETAAPASIILQDKNGASSLLVAASSEGTWGNQIVVSVKRQAPRAQTFLTLDAAAGDHEVTIRSTHGFRPGTLVRIYNEEAQEYRYLEGVSGKMLRWAADEPLGREMRASAPTYIELVEFELTVSTPFRREVFSDLSLKPGSPYFVERVVQERSSLAVVKLMPSRSPVPDNLPVDLVDAPLTGGQDGLHNVTPDDFIGMGSSPGNRRGLAALELVEELDLLAMPDIMWLFQRNAGKDGMPFSTLKDVQVVHDAMLDQCEMLLDRFAILDSPFPLSPERTREYRLQFDSRFGGLYFPWIHVEHKGQMVPVPPSGHIAGIFAMCDEKMGVHRPPANEVIQGAEGLSIVLREEDIGYLNGEGINCIRSTPSRGIRVWGARTVCSDVANRFVNVRRILNAITKAVNLNMHWVVFEPNQPSLWKTVDRNLTQFLVGLWREGYLRGMTPEDAFYIKCDDETNPPSERNAGRMNVEIGVAPVRPAEFMVLRLAQEMQETEKGG